MGHLVWIIPIMALWLVGALGANYEVADRVLLV